MLNQKQPLREIITIGVWFFQRQFSVSVLSIGTVKTKPYIIVD